ncbi:sensor histidine kinase [Cohnella sp. WQ 127256]|uniref:sensor histidine kinase n=1 Tax=Cohnella sp. WQ 127256 TaxID=2938790 RepID=UPI00211907BA|nr:histidine kinase [Cohnella sp. WQ 127256]
MSWGSKWYQGPKSVQRRIIILLVSIFIPLIIILYTAYHFSERTMVHKVAEINRIKVEQTASRVKDLFQRTFMSTNNFIYDKAFIQALQEKDSMSIEKNSTYLQAIERLQYTFFLNEKYAVVIQDNYGNMFESNPSRLGIRKGELQAGILKTIHWEGYDFFNSYQWGMLKPEGGSEPLIVLSRWIFSPVTANKRGIVSMVIPLSNLKEILNQDNGSYAIWDDKNNLIFSTEAEQPRREETTSDSKILLPPTPWSMMQTDSTAVIQNELRYFQLTVMATILIILVIFITTSTFVMKTISQVFNQIRLLSKRLVNPSLDLSVAVHSDQHLAELSELLQQLIHNLQISRDNLEWAATEKRNLEMQILQEQMNPHFLLNSLNTIRFLAEQSSQDKIGSLVLSLSYLLKQQLYRNEGYWTLEEEKEYLLKYIEIQRARFGENIIVKIDFSKELTPMPILRMLLQPLVENSFEHGFNGRANGCILIQADRWGSGVRFVVSDDGVGFAASPQLTARKSIGLSNVRERLRLHYGEQSVLEITVRQPSGTIISLTIPDLKGEVV